MISAVRVIPLMVAVALAGCVLPLIDQGIHNVLANRIPCGVLHACITAMRCAPAQPDSPSNCLASIAIVSVRRRT